MPYNTRHKSLSLSSLGIHIPVTYAERAAAASARSIAANSKSKHATCLNPGDSSCRPIYHNKRLKRTHHKDGASLHTTSSREETKIIQTDIRSRVALHNHTPPRSPDRAPSEQTCNHGTQPATRIVDVEGINDEVVQAVITQLEATANRPHLVQELASILSQRLMEVARSANPKATISSRLSAYMKRPYWSAIAPCPLAKDFTTSLPRRSYFYLTTCPRLHQSDVSISQLPCRPFISPSVSGSSSACSFSGEDDEDGCSYRRELSPSPDVDLSPASLDDLNDETPSTAAHPGSHPPLGATRSHRSASPPLEKDEREFTQTADGLHKRKLIAETASGSYVEESHLDDTHRDDNVFGETPLPTMGASLLVTFTASPAVRASYSPSYKKDADDYCWPRVGKILEWDPSPEDIGLDELDCLLDAC